MITKVRREHDKIAHKTANFSRANNTCMLWHSKYPFQLLTLLMMVVHQSVFQMNKVLS
jgi:hypothetical protein